MSRRRCSRAQYRLDRADRYDRFLQLRSTLDVFRKDPAVKAMLAGLRRKYRRRTTADTQPPEQPAPSAHSAAATTAPAPGAELPSNRIVAQA